MWYVHRYGYRYGYGVEVGMAMALWMAIGIENSSLEQEYPRSSLFLNSVISWFCGFIIG